MLPPSQEASFQELVARAHAGGIFDQEQTCLLFLTAALAIGCKPCIHRFMNQARELGIGQPAVGMATAIAMCVRAGGLRASLMELTQPQDQ